MNNRFARIFFVSLTALFLVGCGGQMATNGSITQNITSPQRAEDVKRALNGTWNGYIKDNPWTNLQHRTPTLLITAEENYGNWSAHVWLNGKRPSDVKLYVTYNGEVSLEIMEEYQNLLIWYKLNLLLRHKPHLMGEVYFGSRMFTPAQASFEKRI